MSMVSEDDNVADLCGLDYKVGKCWGMGLDTAKDSGPWEGELRSLWKPTQ
ncbi:hypothetical protein [Psychrobacter sp. TB55-MNA-CIBAN-0194]